MGDWPNFGLDEPARSGYLSTATTLIDNGYFQAPQSTSTAWPSANLAIFVPVRLSFPATVYKLTAGCGSTGGGNFDMGVYDAQGNRLVSSGTTARSATTEITADVTDTRIGPGTYYLAMSVDGTNNMIMFTFAGTSPVPAQRARLIGALEMATAFVLPSSATFAAVNTSAGNVPALLAHLRDF